MIPLKKQTLDCYSFNLYSGLSAPSLMLEHPLLVELYGAGFTKSPQCQVCAHMSVNRFLHNIAERMLVLRIALAANDQSVPL